MRMTCSKAGLCNFATVCHSAPDSRSSEDSFLLQLKPCRQNILVYKDHSLAKDIQLFKNGIFFLLLEKTALSLTNSFLPLSFCL